MGRMKLPLTLLALALPASAQFTLAPEKIPSGFPDNASRTENVDFGDVDLDGDWDVVMADGGDFGNDQNRIWMNQGGLQGGVKGTFVDETATRFPPILDQSRDIELADLDGDADLDVFVANTSQLMPQPCRFWINQGGQQGGAIATYVDETAARYLGLGGPGSSIHPGFVFAAGGFVDWASDGDFADFDNDGDLDLLQVSIGGASGGQVPTRIFLNDGEGFFTELNPSGFQLTGSTIKPGDPGLWCDGVQTSHTTDTTGAECDVATSAEDADVGDVDGDFDLDLLLGDRIAAPRMFANRLDGSGLAPAAGELRFRDVTGGVFAPGHVTANGAFEQELGDLDGDHDLDILGLNWGATSSPPSFPEKVLVNDGAGHFLTEIELPGSDSDDNEGDLLDFDSDGDLDVYVANWSGMDRLYRNDGALSFTQEPLPAFTGTAVDADAADLDGDGDPEVLVGHENNQPNVLLLNEYDVADVHAPVVAALESVSAAAAFAGVLPVRASVYDNAPYYVAYFNPTYLEVTVDGAVLPPLAMKSSGGQVFRGELPGNLVGSVSYRVVAFDEYGNAGASASRGYGASGDAGTAFGAPSSGGTTGLASLTATFAGETSYLRATAPPGAAVIVGASAAKLSPPLAVPGLANLLLNLAPPVIVIASGAAGAGGDLVAGVPVPAAAGGATVHLQAVSFDGATLESSTGLTLVVQP
jgi:hypothetical protein